MDYTFKSHPTRYSGVLFRSRLEARWAAFFDIVGWKWEYEPIDLEGWTPDFRVEIRCHHSECVAPGFDSCVCQELLIEVKPYSTATDFKAHPLANHERPYVGPHPVGVGLNPYVSTAWEGSHGCGGGTMTLLEWIPRHDCDVELAWKEAGNQVMYQRPKY